MKFRLISAMLLAFLCGCIADLSYAETTAKDVQRFCRQREGTWIGEMTWTTDGKRLEVGGQITSDGKPLDELQDVYHRVSP